jgi:methyltransferase (TIGR00027 family)
MHEGPLIDDSPSRTSLGVAWLRAAHQIVDAEPRILDDPIVSRLLDPRAIDRIRTDPARLQTAGARALRAHVVVRSRYAEDRLREAVARGVRQLVVLGAGLDTFAYRQPPWAAALRVFEVDWAATQTDKRARLARAGVAVPENVTFVPIDFERTAVADALAGHGFDPAAPAFVSWLGVMMYLTRDAIAAVFAFVRALPPSSEIVFSFMPAAADTVTVDGQSFADRVASLGEPLRTHIAPEALVAWLTDMGFGDVTLLTPEDVDVRYIAARTDGLQTSRHTTIASARV